MHLSTRSRNVYPRGHLARARRRPTERFHVEALEARCMMAADVVIQWDQALINETLVPRLARSDKLASQSTYQGSKCTRRLSIEFR